MTLYLHQVDGVKWLHETLSALEGGILADEMGLGKTVQCSTYVGNAISAGTYKKVLVVAPGILLDTWNRDMQSWGRLDQILDILVVRAGQTDKHKRIRVGRGDFNQSVVIITYGLLRNDVENWDVTWDLVILDEGHIIKNLQSKAAKACKAIQVRTKLVVTGTPVMNNLDELYALFDFIHPHIINMTPQEFYKNYSLPVEDGQVRDSTEMQVQTSRHKLDELFRERLRPYILRRTKAELPYIVTAGKFDYVVWTVMTSMQEKLYCAYSKEVRDDLKNKLIIRELSKLKSLCDHTWLHMPQDVFNQRVAEFGVSPATEPHDESQEPRLEDDGDEEFQDCVSDVFQDCQKEVLSPGSIANLGDLYEGSAKIGVLLRILRHHVSKGEKVLVFSRSLRLLQIVAAVLSKEGFTGVERLDGSMKLPQRRDVVKLFNDKSSSSNVCLLTSQVGGLGLTMIGASCVVLLNPSWNPAVDAQAIDRAHRIGQDKDVRVYRLVTCGTVEEKIYRRQIFKENILARERNGEMAENLFKREELKGFLSVGTTSRSQTHAELMNRGGREDLEGKASRSALGSGFDVTDHAKVLRTKLANVPVSTSSGSVALWNEDENPRYGKKKPPHGVDEERTDGPINKFKGGYDKKRRALAPPPRVPSVAPPVDDPAPPPPPPEGVTIDAEVDSINAPPGWSDIIRAGFRRVIRYIGEVTVRYGPRLGPRKRERGE